MPVVNENFGLLMFCDFGGRVNGLLLRGMKRGVAFSTFFPYRPSFVSLNNVLVRHNFLSVCFGLLNQINGSRRCAIQREMAQVAHSQNGENFARRFRAIICMTTGHRIDHQPCRRDAVKKLAVIWAVGWLKNIRQKSRCPTGSGA